MASIFFVALKVMSSLKVEVPLSEEYQVKPDNRGRIKREIASNKSSRDDSYRPYQNAQPDYRVNTKDQSNFATENSIADNNNDDKEPNDNDAPSSGEVDSPSIGSSSPARGRASSPSLPNSDKKTEPSAVAKAAATGGPGTYSSGGQSTFGQPPKTTPTPTNTDTEVTSNGGPASTPVDTVNLTCSVNLGEGSYQAPSSVSISCSTAADIKYCLGENVCCDPESSGVVYTTPITVGTEAKTYCLSYIGLSDDSVSSIYQKSYTFNPSMPALSVAHTKTYYQTTQLSGVDYISSTNFGTPHNQIGQINFKLRDPGPSGLNLTCDEVIDTYSSYTLPSPVVVLGPLDTSSFSPSDQVEVILSLAKLDYGNNFITTYAKNTDYADKKSCSTTNVVLYDFEYFQDTVAHGDVGTDTVREFSGGFSPYGFFETDTQVYRGPAGVSTENQSGQELRTGLFSVFY